MHKTRLINGSWKNALSPRNRYERLGALPSKLRLTVGTPGWRTGSTYDRLQALGSKLPTSDLTAHELKVFSQNGEDGVIVEILQRIGASVPYFVEFGAGRGESGNCVFLADVVGWSGLFIEASRSDFMRLDRKYSGSEQVETRRDFIRPDNIESILAAESVPEDLAVMSIDIDGNDYYVWEAITAHRPRLVIIEYNGSIPLSEQLVQPYDPDWAWDGTDYWGSSLGALEALGKLKGYTLVHTDLTGVNAFFVDSKYAAKVNVSRPPRRVSNYELLGIQHPLDPLERKYVDIVADSPDKADKLHSAQA